MELSVDAQWAIFQISYDMNIYFRKKLIDAYLEFGHSKRTAIDKG